MKRVFISNNTEVATKDFEINKDFDAINLPVKAEHQDGNTVFVIDVHCTFKKAEKMQQQGGVIIYRHLLKIFEGKQDKLKVVFYSPIPQEDLVKLKPENYVLKLLPFVECKYEVGQFESDLSAEIAKYEKEGWVQFNNASENLLSGWALSGEKSIRLRSDKKILFIDDENAQWKITLDLLLGESNYTIFESGTKENFRNHIQPLLNLAEKSNKEEITAHNIGTLLQNELSGHYLVLSDFYLTESHTPEHWMDEKELTKKSGYKLFATIKTLDPAIPFVFHTSSNKVTYYKFFDQLGVDDWHIKDSRNEATRDEKTTNYKFFSEVINSLYKQPQMTLYERLRSILNNIIFAEKMATYWWRDKEHIHQAKFSKSLYPDLIFQQLYESWFAIRQFVNKESSFESLITADVNRRTDYFIPVSVIANLYKIKEDFQDKLYSNKFTVNIGSNWLDNALEVIRNTASHIRHKNAFHVIDAVIYFELALKYLELITFKEKDRDAIDFRFVVKNDLDTKYNSQEYNYSSAICYLTIHKKGFLKELSFNSSFENLFLNNLNNKIKELNRTNNSGYAQSDALYKDLIEYKNDISIITTLIDSLMKLCNNSITNYNDLDSCLHSLREKSKTCQNTIGRSKIIPFNIFGYKPFEAIGHSKENKGIATDKKKEFAQIKQEFEASCKYIFTRQRTILQNNSQLVDELLQCFYQENGTYKISQVK